MPIDERGPFPLRDINADNCRFCGVSLIGAAIPANERYPSGGSNYRREIGVEVDGYDGLAYFYCPGCLFAWSGFVGGIGPGSMSEFVRPHVEQHNRNVRDAMPRAIAALREHAAEIEQILASHGAPPPWRWCFAPGAGSVCLALDRRPGHSWDDVLLAEKEIGARLGCRVQLHLFREDEIDHLGRLVPDWRREQWERESAWPPAPGVVRGADGD